MSSQKAENPELTSLLNLNGHGDEGNVAEAFLLGKDLSVSIINLPWCRCRGEGVASCAALEAAR